MTDHWTSLRTTRLIAASLVVAVAGTGHAFFIAANTQPQKNRADISVQSSKYMAWLEGARGCEKTGTTVDQECFLATGTVSPASIPTA